MHIIFKSNRIIKYYIRKSLVNLTTILRDLLHKIDGYNYKCVMVGIQKFRYETKTMGLNHSCFQIRARSINNGDNGVGTQQCVQVEVGILKKYFSVKLN